MNNFEVPRTIKDMQLLVNNLNKLTGEQKTYLILTLHHTVTEVSKLAFSRDDKELQEVIVRSLDK